MESMLFVFVALAGFTTAAYPKTTPGIIEINGYPLESHNVTTEDGYILTMHRIPYGKNGSSSVPRQPVMLQHGLVSSSIFWVWNTPDKNLAFLLADAGYDVWLGNYRGNEYTTHATMKESSSAYWDFSFDELGKYDLPAMIDFILKTNTGFSQILYAGHSMGNTAAFAMFSIKPEYNDKVKVFVALAPGAFVGHMRSPLRYFPPILMDAMSLLTHGKYAMPAGGDALSKFVMSSACKPEIVAKYVCSMPIFAVIGPDEPQLNKTRLSYYLSVFPSTSSVRAVKHYLQLVSAEKFQKYDYGLLKNAAVYGGLTAPEYNLSKVTVSTALFVGENDWMFGPEDVELLKPKLKNLILYHVVPKFNHGDFGIAIDVNPLLNNHILEVFKNATR